MLSLSLPFRIWLIIDLVLLGLFLLSFTIFFIIKTKSIKKYFDLFDYDEHYKGDDK